MSDTVEQKRQDFTKARTIHTGIRHMYTGIPPGDADAIREIAGEGMGAPGL